MDKPHRTSPPGAPPANAGQEHRVLDSAELFDRHPVINIRHDGQLYTLRLTASNKLILTK